MMQCGYLHGSPNKLFHSTWFIDVFLSNMQACPIPQSQCFNIFGLSSNSNNFYWLDRVAGIVSTLDWKWFSVTAIFGSDGTGGMVIDWDASCFSSCSSNCVICSFRIVFYRSFGRILVTCILIFHFLCEHLYPRTQLVNHLPQLTDSLITIKWITLKARNLYWDRRLCVLPADFETMLQML